MDQKQKDGINAILWAVITLLALVIGFTVGRII